MAKKSPKKIINQEKRPYGHRMREVESSSCPPTACSVLDKLEAYERVRHPTREDDDQQLMLALALRCYHLPNHSWCEDWLQYFQNNHPVCGIFCHYRAHPVKVGLRLIFLFGSIVFGLTITNAMWLWFIYQGADQNAPVLTINVNGFEGNMNNSTIRSDESSEVIQITQGMLVLWTFGGAFHALFDNTIWYVSVCACCLSSTQLPKFRCCASYCIVFLVLSLTAVATFAVLLRTSIENSQPPQDYLTDTAPKTASILRDDDHIPHIQVQKASSYEFLLSYATEFLLATFVYYPVVGTILFSGYLGCGNIPILGGRPYEVKVEQQRHRRTRNQIL